MGGTESGEGLGSRGLFALFLRRVFMCMVLVSRGIFAFLEFLALCRVQDLREVWVFGLGRLV